MNPMKLAHRLEGNSIFVRVSGAIDTGKCDCLRHFWDRFVTGPFAAVHVEMEDVDAMDAESVATAIELLRENLAAGSRIILVAPPQMLAHTLYKTAMTADPNRLVIHDPQTESPYAG